MPLKWEAVRGSEASRQGLIDRDLAGVESLGGAEHVEPPRSLALVSGGGDRFGLVRVQVGSPVPQR